MKKIKLLFVLTSLFVSSAAWSQFNIDASIRPRGEFRNGFKKLQPDQNASQAFFIEQRSRLAFGYKSDNVKVGVTLQDVRIWGEVGQINKSDGLSSIHEAWAQILFSKKASAKIGRQELVYDDHRLLGSLGWAAQGRSHDALRLMFGDTTWNVHLVLAYNQSSDIPEPRRLTTSFFAPNTNAVGFALGNPKDMEFLWVSKEINKAKITALILHTGFQTGIKDSTENVSHLTTMGVNPSINLGNKAKAYGSYYHQFGENISAYLGSVNLSYKASDRLTLTLGSDFVSGVDSTTVANGTNRPFNVLFGTHHKFYGFMDYFYVGNPHGLGGLNDSYLKFKFNASKKVSFSLDTHYFSSNASIIKDGVEMSSGLGTELDLVAAYKYDGNVQFNAGYSQMFGSSTLEYLKGGSSSSLNNWAWLMVTVNQNLFTSKN